MNESFAGSDVTSTPWLYGVSGSSANPYLTARTGAASPNGIPGGFGAATDAPGSGALRLTEAEPGQSTFVIYNQVLSANAGFSVSFDFAAYG